VSEELPEFTKKSLKLLRQLVAATHASGEKDGRVLLAALMLYVSQLLKRNHPDMVERFHHFLDEYMGKA
jgi:hypothetical protein